MKAAEKSRSVSLDMKITMRNAYCAVFEKMGTPFDAINNCFIVNSCFLRVPLKYYTDSVYKFQRIKRLKIFVKNVFWYNRVLKLKFYKQIGK